MANPRDLHYKATTREIVEIINQILRGKINIVAGSNVTVTQNATDVTIASTGGGGGAPTTAEYITSSADATLSAERVLTNTATVTWDFTTPGQAKATATAAGASWSETELDFGTSPVWNKQLTITDAAITGTSKVIVVPSGNAPTGLQSDEWEMDSITFAAKAAAGSATVYASALPGPITGKRKVFYTVA